MSKTVTIQYLTKKGFIPINTNIGRMKPQIIGSMLTTKDGRLYMSEIYVEPQKVKGICLKGELVYSEPKLVEGFKVKMKTKQVK